MGHSLGSYVNVQYNGSHSYVGQIFIALKGEMCLFSRKVALKVILYFVLPKQSKTVKTKPDPVRSANFGLFLPCCNTAEILVKLQKCARDCSKKYSLNGQSCENVAS